MDTTTPTSPLIDPIDALRRLTPEQIERRLADLDLERTTLSRLLRSMRAGERARRKTLRISSSKGGTS